MVITLIEKLDIPSNLMNEFQASLNLLFIPVSFANHFTIYISLSGTALKSCKIKHTNK